MWWWVNQSRTYELEKDGSFIFAVPLPKRTKHHDDVKLVMPGDNTLHYNRGALRAIGLATSGFAEQNRHDGQGGWSVDVDYSALNEPIMLSEIPLESRLHERSVTSGSVFNINGGVREGYLFPLSDDFVSTLRNIIGQRFAYALNLLRSKTISHSNDGYNVWSYLINFASKRETIAIDDFAALVGLTQMECSKFLEQIELDCAQRNLPNLAALVDGDQYQIDQVWAHNWSVTSCLIFFTIDSELEDAMVDKLANSPKFAFDLENELMKYSGDIQELYGLKKLRGLEQRIFRTILKRLYCNQCSFCGLSFEAALEAAHINPWSTASERYQRVSPNNGILLCSTHHRMFDAQLLTLDENYKIRFCGPPIDKRSAIDEFIGSDLNGKHASVPTQEMHRPSKEFLKQRNERLRYDMAESVNQDGS